MIAATIGLLIGYQLQEQRINWPLTRAERTSYAETSHYDDVIEFVRDLQRLGSPIRLSFIGESFEHRPIPMVVASWPPVETPQQAHRSGKVVVYVQANIHAGEVEGKEAAQMLLREVSQQVATGKPGLLDKLVLVVNPIYNADGNEKWGPQERNRPEQVGPEQVGVRANGQGFDLNRDCMKVESPEMKFALDSIYNHWDPDVIMDLHTTDGTRHGYELTYAPAMNPNTNAAITKFTRDEMLPFIRSHMKKRDGLELFDYGDAVTRDKKQVWSTFACEGRYVTNYSGLRNRICVLSEATTYIPFKDRVSVTDKFVNEVLDYVAKNASRVAKITREADAQTIEWGSHPGKTLGVRFDFDQRGTEETLLEKPTKPTPTGRPKDIVKVKMPIFERFKITKTAMFPAAYVIPESDKGAVSLLLRHGIGVEQLREDASAPATIFTIRSIKKDASAFQGHHLTVFDGDFSQVSTTSLAKGSYLVRTAQPLGLLAFHLLEPEMNDGLVAWELIGQNLAVGDRFPILKLMSGPKCVTDRLTQVRWDRPQ